jgi:hypothetical protein
MLVRLTTIICQNDHTKPVDSDDYFKILLDMDHNLPSCLISTKDEKQTLKSLYEEYLNVPFDWLNISLLDFRKKTFNECEVIYGCKMPPIMNAAKKGKFISQNSNIYLDNFYERLISSRSRPGFYWS